MTAADAPYANRQSAASRWGRSLGRIALFPVVLGVGVFIGILAVLLNPHTVLTRLRQRRSAIFQGFSPEERKVIRNLLIGFACVGLVALVLVLLLHGWR